MVFLSFFILQTGTYKLRIPTESIYTQTLPARKNQNLYLPLPDKKTAPGFASWCRLIYIPRLSVKVLLLSSNYVHFKKPSFNSSAGSHLDQAASSKLPWLSLK